MLAKTGHAVVSHVPTRLTFCCCHKAGVSRRFGILADVFIHNLRHGRYSLVISLDRWKHLPRKTAGSY